MHDTTHEMLELGTYHAFHPNIFVLRVGCFMVAVQVRNVRMSMLSFFTPLNDPLRF
jgi:hypothetical protein